MATRVGPTLTLAASCERCRWLSRDMTVWRCAHPLIAGTRKPAIGGSTMEPATPSGCPELPGARLALLVDLARTLCRRCGSTVEGERIGYTAPLCGACLRPSPLDLVPPDEAAIHRRMGSTPIVDPDALFGQELRVYPMADEERAREAQKESE